MLKVTKNDVTVSADSREATGAGTPADALGVTKRMCSSDGESEDSNGVECPTCGRNFDTERGMRSHHGIKHEVPFPDRVEMCVECEEEFEGDPGETNKYCSIECKHEGLRGSVNDAHPLFDRRKVECEWCGETEYVPPSRATDYRFCSRACQGAWQSAERTGKNSSNWQGGIDKSTSQCQLCGEGFEYKTGSCSGRFCSHECYYDYHVGENHSQWAGGEVGYKGRWKRRRRKAVERDGNECVVCGMSDKEHVEEYSFSLDVHHIIPYRDFEDPNEANALENLITLCRGCHREWEGIPVKPTLMEGE